MKCYCGSKKDFDQCCEPIIAGKVKPANPEALMRSRYSAFALADVAYIEKTTDPSQRDTFDREGTLHWAKSSEWLGLEIVEAPVPEATATTGQVEFIAKYKHEGQESTHHERSEFKKRDGQWYFVDGRLVQEPFVASDKIGRNDPCPCGSQKKYKKCCGAA
jgi:SEC-C motif-containing protein